MAFIINSATLVPNPVVAEARPHSLPRPSKAAKRHSLPNLPVCAGARSCCVSINMKKSWSFCRVAAMALALFFLHSLSTALGDETPRSTSRRRTMGINYGRLGSDLPNPAESVRLMQSLGFTTVKIFDSDAAVLTALAQSKPRMRVVMAATNEEIDSLAASPEAASAWVSSHVLPFLPAVRIRTITVGNELLSRQDLRASWPNLVPAMRNLRRALDSAAAASAAIKLTTCLAMDTLNTSYPPSAGAFRTGEQEAAVVRPLLSFLSATRAPLYVNAYPYLAYAAAGGQVPLPYALMEAGSTEVADGALTYRNLLDAQLDAVVAAMDRLGFGDVRIVVGETGWPTGGGPGASVENAEIYTQNLVSKMVGRGAPPGTPRRPGVFIPTYIFALFNENEKGGAATEQHWGLLYPNATHVYPFALPPSV